jgi:hypothetical protein
VLRCARVGAKPSRAGEGEFSASFLAGMFEQAPRLIVFNHATWSIEFAIPNSCKAVLRKLSLFCGCASRSLIVVRFNGWLEINRHYSVPDFAVKLATDDNHFHGRLTSRPMIS